LERGGKSVVGGKSGCEGVDVGRGRKNKKKKKKKKKKVLKKKKKN
jgi:hypothetical protein